MQLAWRDAVGPTPATLSVHVDGTRDGEETPVDLDAVTLVRFDEVYVNLYGKYSLDAHHH